MALLTEQVAVVTGGSSGIGRGIARAFSNHGAGVVVADVREEPMEGGAPTHEAIEDETDASATSVECDVTDVSQLEAAVAAAAEFGGVDVMVNNAGTWHAEDFLETTVEDFQRMIDVNLRGRSSAPRPPRGGWSKPATAGASSTCPTSPASSVTVTGPPTPHPRTA